MSYSKLANDNYRKKCKSIGLKFTPNEIQEYNRIVAYCKKNKLSYQKYIKSLIISDLNNKGIEYSKSDSTDMDYKEE